MLYNTRLNKRNLESILEQIPGFSTPKRSLEQYVTPSDIAAEILWTAFMNGDIYDKTVVDLGCGTLRLSIGALILGARQLFSIDVDCDVIKEAINIAKDIDFAAPHIHRLVPICSDVRETSMKHADTVVMNPPFGVYRRNRGIDILFLKKAFEIADSIYSIHKFSLGLRRIIRELSDSYGFKIVEERIRELMIPMMFETHTRRIYRVKTVIYIFRKTKSNRE